MSRFQYLYLNYLLQFECNYDNYGKRILGFSNFVVLVGREVECRLPTALISSWYCTYSVTGLTYSLELHKRHKFTINLLNNASDLKQQRLVISKTEVK